MRKPVILLIEDNPTTQKMFRIALECENYNIIEARDGESALKQLHLIKPDLILQDLILPDIGYIELNYKLRTHPNGLDVPILALSGFLNKPEDNQFNEEFSAFLIKPIETSRLVSVVKSFLPNTTPLLKNTEKKKILIVDDNKAQLRILQLHLMHHGFEVETAENGNDALERISKHIPDVIVSDVLMPEMDGFELCLEIRRKVEFSHVPIILMTSQYLEESDRKLAKKAGADFYITRTPDIDKLIAILNDCLNQKETVLSIFPETVELFKEEHTHRLIRQLERQINANAGLAQRCALQYAHLSMLGEIANTLTDSMRIEKTLENVLSTCLDAAGISRGALYLINEEGNMTLQKMIGYNQEHKIILENFIKSPSILSEILSSKDVIEISAEQMNDKLIEKLLTDTEMTSALLTPLISDAQCLGVLLLGSNTTSINNVDSINFTRNLSTQIGQAIALAKAIENIYYSEQRYRILMDNASCGIFIFNHNGNILEVNKQGEKLLNCSKENIIKKNFLNFIIETDKQLAISSLKKLIVDKSTGPTEIRIKPLNQTECTVEYTAVEVQIKNENVLMVMTTDVSERNKLKAQAMLNDKLATVGTLAAGVAHEINNPISWVMTNLMILKNNMDIFKKNMHAFYDIIQEPNMEKKLQALTHLTTPNHVNLILEFEEMINDSLQGVERVRDIVKNLKGFSRMNETEMTSVNIHDVLNVAINMASVEYKYRASLEKHYAQNLPPVSANSGKLNQVFLNLIINAAQSIPEGDVNQNTIRVTTKLNDDSIQVDILDTGRGMPPEILPHIFDPFFTTKSAGHGTGLGLSICHEIVSHLNGKIEVKSEINQGTTFSVYLPILQEPKQKANNINIVKENQRKHILIVDDEPYLLKSLINILKHNYETTTALGGRLASEILQLNKGEFDAIICDLQMPDMNGADLYHFVIKHYPALSKRFIFTTGGLFSPILKDFLLNNKHPLLEKPFSHEELINTIETCLA